MPARGHRVHRLEASPAATGSSGTRRHQASPPCSRAIWRTSDRPRPVPAPSSPKPVERREHALAFVFRNPWPGIDDVENGRARLTPKLDPDRRRTVTLRILQQVADEAPQQPCIARIDRRRAVEPAALMRAHSSAASASRSTSSTACSAGWAFSRLDSRISSTSASSSTMSRSSWALYFGSCVLAYSSMPSRRRDSGVRSSCDAFASSRRWAFTSSSMRAAERLKASARCATSSRPGP